MLSLAAECHVRTIVCIIDHGARYRSLDVVGVGQQLLKWLFERYSMFLIGVRDTGIMIADRGSSGFRVRGLRSAVATGCGS
ncbi:hypothetical protein [Pseudonocardia sp. NPDC049154]|uniref:hypothetical protein n=1 Tax=Pseudonocardia sp. NPDC049154 TaxID=3155501 RepID=UPI0033CF8723